MKKNINRDKNRDHAEKDFTQFLLWIFKVGFFLWKTNPLGGEVTVQRSGGSLWQIFIKSRSKKMFHFFSQSFEKKSYETNKSTVLTV